MKRLSFLAFCAVLAVAGSAFAQETIKIGEFGSLTGDNASFGTSQNNGVQMAVEEINAAGGVLGKKIDLTVEDNMTKQGETTTIARKLISQDHVVAIIGEVASSKTLEAAPIAQAAKIPLIATAATNPKVTQTGDYVFRVCFTDDFQAVVIARFVLEKLKQKNIAFMTDVKQDYSVGLTKIAKDYLAKNGGNIVKEQSYSSGDKDFRAQLTDLKSANPDVIIITGYYPEASLIAKQARQFGIKATLVGGDGWDGSSLIPVGGKAIEGAFFSNHFSTEDKSPLVQDFVKKYKQKYNAVPDAFAALGYDATKLLADAIKRAGSTDSDKIRAAIQDTEGFPGVSGKITIGKDRNAVKSAVILTIKDGALKYAETIEPKPALASSAQ
ncbi:MAG TPA: ABC transporter substrate-binding protein [Chthoniobacterales bacterium]|jgi:branched-chain amino acid transport system substrate-binding protein|nr:ABC transporter substrate-binding protein [Chthoniobacterales bacterium]